METVVISVVSKLQVSQFQQTLKNTSEYQKLYPKSTFRIWFSVEGKYYEDQ